MRENNKTYGLFLSPFDYWTANSTRFTLGFVLSFLEDERAIVSLWPTVKGEVAHHGASTWVLIQLSDVLRDCCARRSNAEHPRHPTCVVDALCEGPRPKGRDVRQVAARGAARRAPHC